MPVETVEKEKDKGKPRKTIRFNLTLTESSEEACPEFSYNELVKNALVSLIKMFENYKLYTPALENDDCQ